MAIKNIFYFIMFIFFISYAGTSVQATSLPDKTSIVSYHVKPEHIKNQQELALAGLQAIINHDATVKKLLNSALASAQPNSVWHHRTIKDFSNFLVQWMYFLPKPNNALSMGLKFQNFAKTTQAKAFLNNGKVEYCMWQFFNAKSDFLNSPESVKNIPLFLKNNKINMNNFIIPKDGFNSYNQFFVRSLKPGARHIAGYQNNRIVVSPNDGVIKLIERHVKLDKAIVAKGDALMFSKIFTGISAVAKKFIGGPLLYTQLGPLDYHHFHAPIGGKVLFAQKYYGGYESPEIAENVNIKSNFIQQAYQHRRAVIIIYNKKIGLIACVPLGYWMVGSIQLNVKAGDTIKQGQDLGNFAYGGSGILLFFQPNRVMINPAYQDKKTHIIKVGVKIATIDP